MKKYMVYMDDGRDCFKVAVPAMNEKEARKYVEGNGEVPELYIASQKHLHQFQEENGVYQEENRKRAVDELFGMVFSKFL